MSAPLKIDHLSVDKTRCTAVRGVVAELLVRNVTRITRGADI